MEKADENSTAVERQANEKFMEEERKIDWEQTPKVILVAPSIDPDLLILQNFLNIDVEFFEIGVYLHQK